MSYFEHFYNPAGEKTLRAYSKPVNLARFDRNIHWRPRSTKSGPSLNTCARFRTPVS